MDPLLEDEYLQPRRKRRDEPAEPPTGLHINSSAIRTRPPRPGEPEEPPSRREGLPAPAKPAAAAPTEAAPRGGGAARAEGRGAERGERGPTDRPPLAFDPYALDDIFAEPRPRPAPTPSGRVAPVPLDAGWDDDALFGPSPVRRPAAPPEPAPPRVASAELRLLDVIPSPDAPRAPATPATAPASEPASGLPDWGPASDIKVRIRQAGASLDDLPASVREAVREKESDSGGRPRAAILVPLGEDAPVGSPPSAASPAGRRAPTAPAATPPPASPASSGSTKPPPPPSPPPSQRPPAAAKPAPAEPTRPAPRQAPASSPSPSPPAAPAPEPPKPFVPASVLEREHGSTSDSGDAEVADDGDAFEDDLSRRFGSTTRRMREKISQREMAQQAQPSRGPVLLITIGVVVLLTVGIVLGYRYWVRQNAADLANAAPRVIVGPQAGTPGGAATSATSTPVVGPPGTTEPPLLPVLPPPETIEGKLKRAVAFGLPVYRAPEPGPTGRPR